MTETDFWKWFNEHLKGNYASISKQLLAFTLLSLLTIALGAGWIEMEKFSGLGASVKFTKSGALFLLVISCLATVIAFLNLIATIGQGILLSMTNNRNPYVLMALTNTGLSQTQLTRLNSIINKFALGAIVLGTVMVITLLVAAVSATITGLGGA